MAKLRAVKEAGFEGVQGSDINLCKRLGLRYTANGRVNAVGVKCIGGKDKAPQSTC